MMMYHGYMASIKQNYEHFNRIGLMVLAFYHGQEGPVFDSWLRRNIFLMKSGL